MNAETPALILNIVLHMEVVNKSTFWPIGWESPVIYMSVFWPILLNVIRILEKVAFW